MNEMMRENLILRWCRWSALAVLVAGGGHLGLAAQGPESSSTNALTLDEAVRLALESNPELRASGARVDAASGRAYQAKKWTNPELELSAEDWPVSNGRGFSDAKETIGIAQTLPYPGKKTLDKQIGGAGVKLSEAELTLRRTEIVRDVKAGFYRVLASERLVEVSTQLVAEAELHGVQQQLQREWANALKRYRTAAEQVANYRERILPKANEALRLVQTGFEQGKFSFIDLVDTQRTTAEVRLAYQQKLLELNIAQAELTALLQPQTDQPSTTK